jgi:hypothetical protein
MSSAKAPPDAQPWIFSELCPRCSAVVNAALCREEFCRRKFVPLPDRSRVLCPVHETPRDERVRASMGEAVRCPACRQNLYGVKDEDRA